LKNQNKPRYSRNATNHCIFSLCIFFIKVFAKNQLKIWFLDWVSCCFVFWVFDVLKIHNQYVPCRKIWILCGKPYFNILHICAKKIMKFFNLYVTFLDFMSIEKIGRSKIGRISNYMDRIYVFFIIITWSFLQCVSTLDIGLTVLTVGIYLVDGRWLKGIWLTEYDLKGPNCNVNNLWD